MNDGHDIDCIHTKGEDEFDSDGTGDGREDDDNHGHGDNDEDSGGCDIGGGGDDDGESIKGDMEMDAVFRVLWFLVDVTNRSTRMEGRPVTLHLHLVTHHRV